MANYADFASWPTTDACKQIAADSVDVIERGHDMSYTLDLVEWI